MAKQQLKVRGFKDTFGKKSHSVCQIWLVPLFWFAQSVVFAFAGDLAMDYLLFKQAQTTLSSSDLSQSQAIEV